MSASVSLLLGGPNSVWFSLAVDHRSIPLTDGVLSSDVLCTTGGDCKELVLVLRDLSSLSINFFCTDSLIMMSEVFMLTQVKITAMIRYS